MVARFARPKRPDVLLDAFGRSGLAECELVIAGEGPQRLAIQARAQAMAHVQVELPGNVHDIPGLLASAQVFVLISDHEAFPLSVLEAMRAGLPVIASDLPGIREQLDDGRCGILLEDNQPQTLARALQALGTDAPRREALGQLARQRWEQQFGLAGMIQSTWSAYQDTLASVPRKQASARQRHAENRQPAPPAAARATGSETIRRASRMLAWALLGLLVFGVNIALAEVARRAGIVDVRLATARCSGRSRPTWRPLCCCTGRCTCRPWRATAWPDWPRRCRSRHCCSYLPASISNTRVARSCWLTSPRWRGFGSATGISCATMCPSSATPMPPRWRNWKPCSPCLAQRPASRTRFQPIRSLAEAAHCDGLMLDRNAAAADPERTRALAQFKLSHAAHLFGRARRRDADRPRGPGAHRRELPGRLRRALLLRIISSARSISAPCSAWRRWHCRSR
ncbi:glycosyltransferase [Cupriavidus basilensis]